MRAVNTCDFCDRTAAGTFELVPPSLEPTEAEQRRAVLCVACRPKVETLLEPFLDRLLEGTGGTEPLDDAGNAVGGGNGPTPPDGDGPTNDDREQSEATATQAVTDDASAHEGAITVDSSSDDERSSSDGSSSEPATGEAPSAAATDQGHSDPDGSTPAGSQRNRAPRGYGKVMRLLRNRDLPMARGDVEALASGAYELEGHEVEAVIEHAIDAGRLVEDGDQLRFA